jgi:hypothetical protein
MEAEKTALPRRSLQAHAPTHIDVGGYMKGERKEGKEKAAGQKIQRIRRPSQAAGAL